MQNMVKRLRDLKAKYKSEKRPPKPRPVINPDKHGVNDTLVQPETPKPVDLTVLKRPDAVKPPQPSQSSQSSQPSQSSQSSQSSQPVALETAPKLPGELGNAGVPKPAARVSVRPPTPLPPGGIHRVGFPRPARGVWAGKWTRRSIGDSGRDDTQRGEEGGEL